MTVTLADVRAFVVGELGGDPRTVRESDAGHWSVCFAFERGDDELVVRFGRQRVDFEMDRYAQRWNVGARLPVPEVLEMGEFGDGHYVVSRFVRGTALEQVGSDEWTRLIPAIADAFDAMRVAPIETDGFGPWRPDGHASFDTWKEYLLSVGADLPSMRTHGWARKLERHPAGAVAMRKGLALLETLDLGDVRPSVVHADMMNRNVHVAHDRIAGVFDWGCSVIGDHVYEIAGLEFYAPYYPDLDIAALADELHDRWEIAGLDLDRDAERRTAAHLHVGLVHFAYNAYLEDWDALTATVDRTRELVPDLR